MIAEVKGDLRKAQNIFLYESSGKYVGLIQGSASMKKDDSTMESVYCAHIRNGTWTIAVLHLDGIRRQGEKRNDPK